MDSLISIIVPVYGVEKYLRQCVDSVLAQTYSNWELILVDDGSPDACPQICDEYSATDPRIRVIHQSNGGLSVARNTGIAASQGKYITFIDSDDKIAPSYLEVLQNAITDHCADVACVAFAVKDDFSSNNFNVNACQYNAIEFSKDLLYQKFLLCTHAAWAKLYRSNLIDKNVFTPNIGYEDLDAFYRIFPKVGKIVYLPLELYYYRPNPQSYLHRFTPRRADVLDVTDKMVDYFGESGAFPNKDLHKAARDRRMSAHFNIFGLMAANSYKDNDLEERCWKVIKSERLSSLLNPEVRVKNKLGALLSYLGKPALRFISRFIYR